ncbi:M1 family metallopeptidase [Rummeliibacillus pycnus]|uniref:M1 family metallopeptidase n=1 Tax=Rummeliibacillus pycnus TaxID=101070 RepID=UPI003D2B5FCB
MKKQTGIILSAFACISFLISGCGKTETSVNENEKIPSFSINSHDKAEFVPKSKAAGSEAKYKISLEMDKKGKFRINSTTHIKNISTDNWKELVFYFIPNIFTKSNSPELATPSYVSIKSIKVDGKKTEFSLEKDTLKIKLSNKLQPNDEVIVNVQYDFTLPKRGLRFTANEKNFFLAQWYPMIATYREHKWNKEDYRVKGETYHTAFSDFEIQYKLSNNLTIISSSDNDTYPSERSGVLIGKDLKEFYIALLKEPNVIEKKIGGIKIRVFGVDKRKDLHSDIMEVASDALTYFQDTIGPYPHKQLDIILDELGMEYPGVVTASSIYRSAPVDSDILKSMVVHEIAHQWFYGVISNDPYHDAWLDEGITSFASNLFYAHYQGKEISMNEELFKDLTLPVNLPLDEYSLGEQSSYIYGKSQIGLWKVFQENKAERQVENFLRKYYENYKYKEVDTNEFIRFLKDYLNLNNDSYFNGWIKLDK